MELLALARLFSPPCNPRMPGFRRTARDTSGHVLTRTERTILWAVTVVAAGVVAIALLEIFL